MNAKAFRSAVLLVLCAVPAQAQDYGCPAFVAPVVDLKLSADEPRYNHSRSSAEIAAIRSAHAVAENPNIPAGLTLMEQKLGADADIRLTTRSDGVTCAQIVAVQVKASLDGIEVFVAREIPEHACGFAAVVEHERKHIDVARAWLNEAGLLAQTQVQGFIGAQGVIRAASPAEAETQARSAFNRFLDQLYNGLIGASADRESQVDTPDEYKRLGSVCGGEIARLLDGNFR